MAPTKGENFEFKNFPVLSGGTKRRITAFFLQTILDFYL
jgi:hypothetical protein